MMSVVLYRKTGNKTESKVFDPFLFESNLALGWNLTKEECFEEEKEEEETPEREEEVLTDENTDEDIRGKAKALNIKNWYNKGIDKLKVEIDEWQPET